MIDRKDVDSAVSGGEGDSADTDFTQKGPAIRFSQDLHRLFASLVTAQIDIGHDAPISPTTSITHEERSEGSLRRSGPSTLVSGQDGGDTRGMTSRWIVGIDGSDSAANALRWAARHSKSRDVQLVVLRAFHVPAGLALLTAKRGFGVDQMGLSATAAHEVDEAIAAVDGLSAESLIVEGHPAHMMVEAAAGAALLVVGRNGEGDLLHHPLGSVSRYCVTHAEAPVMVVPSAHEPGDLNLVAVGFDGSENAVAALRWAVEFAPQGATVRAVAAIEHAPWIGQDLTFARFPTEIHEEEKRITDAINTVDPDGCVERDIALRGARQALTDASATADLLVVGSRGHGRIVSGLLGSVSTAILHSATCPVAVVPVSGQSG